MNNAYSLTVQKLMITKQKLIDGFSSKDWTDAKEAMSQFLSFDKCYYCISYRTNLETNIKGCCDSCPLHKFGNKKSGRVNSYNACYKIPYYREVVRVARLFTEEPNEEIAKLLVANITTCLENLKIHKNEVN